MGVVADMLLGLLFGGRFVSVAGRPRVLMRMALMTGVGRVSVLVADRIVVVMIFRPAFHHVKSADR